MDWLTESAGRDFPLCARSVRSMLFHSGPRRHMKRTCAAEYSGGGLSAPSFACSHVGTPLQPQRGTRTGSSSANLGVPWSGGNCTEGTGGHFPPQRGEEGGLWEARRQQGPSVKASSSPGFTGHSLSDLKRWSAPTPEAFSFCPWKEHLWWAMERKPRKWGESPQEAPA